MHNILGVSLCKDMDHGITMKFGLVTPLDPTSAFDPIYGLSLDECTIRIDTIATNIGMWNYDRHA